jgi:hypothetical protein
MLKYTLEERKYRKFTQIKNTIIFGYYLNVEN